MTGDRFVVDEKHWLTEIVEHWPPGGPEDRPTAYDVIFYDPKDRNQWVGNTWVPADDADLSEAGLRRLFRDASVRSWRDASGTYWRIGTFRAGTLGPNGDGERFPDGIVAFHRRDSSESEMFTRMVAELPPIGTLSDVQLQRLVAPPDTRAPMPGADGPDRETETVVRIDN